MLTFGERWKAEKKRLKAGKGPLTTNIVWHCPWCKKDQPNETGYYAHTCDAQPKDLDSIFRLCERVVVRR